MPVHSMSSVIIGQPHCMNTNNYYEEGNYYRRLILGIPRGRTGSQSS